MQRNIILSSFCLLMIAFHSNAQHSQDSILCNLKTHRGGDYVGTLVNKTSTETTFYSLGEGYIKIPKKEIRHFREIGKFNFNPENGPIYLDISTHAIPDISGRLLERTPSSFKLLTFKGNTVIIDFDQLEKIKQVKYKESSAHSARYLLLPNGLGLKKGKGYYQNTWLIFNNLSYGITDYFQVGAGASATGSPNAWLSAKFNIPIIRDKLSLGVGVMARKLIFGRLAYGYGWPEIRGRTYMGTQAQITLGNRDNNLSLAAGTYQLFNHNYVQTALISLLGMKRIGIGSYLIAEGHLIRSNNFAGILAGVGTRLIRGKVDWEFGLYGIAGGGSEGDLIRTVLMAIPWIGLTVPFDLKTRNREE